MNTTTTATTSSLPQKYGPSVPYIIFQPFNMVTFLSVFSPIILIAIVLSYSFFFQNVKGFVYLGFLLAVLVLRSVILQAMGVDKHKDPCDIVRYTAYGNVTFTTFCFGFTLVYLLLPMFQSGVINWYLTSFLIFYVLFDIGIKVIRGCLDFSKQLSSVIGDFFGGGLLEDLLFLRCMLEILINFYFLLIKQRMELFVVNRKTKHLNALYIKTVNL